MSPLPTVDGSSWTARTRPVVPAARAAAEPAQQQRLGRKAAGHQRRDRAGWAQHPLCLGWVDPNRAVTWISADADVRMTARQAIFTMTVDNRCPYVVENVYCPYLGDVQRPPQRRMVQDLRLPLCLCPGMVDLAEFSEPARLLRRRLPHPGFIVERQQRRPHVALHPAARRRPGPVCRRRRAAQRAGRLAPGTAPWLWRVDCVPPAARTVDRRQRCGRALRRRARPLYPAGRDTHADAGHP